MFGRACESDTFEPILVRCSGEATVGVTGAAMCDVRGWPIAQTAWACYRDALALRRRTMHAVPNRMFEQEKTLCARFVQVREILGDEYGY
ncbi:MAG: hypothetical protein ACI9W2_001916 [Gammaproteobacteria bacterium]|jgi:hypothetical protein